jgi:hypothetical protein
MTLFAGTNKAGTWRASLTIPAGTSGIHYVCFQAADIAGNTTRIAWAIQQELSPPPDTAKPVVVDGSSEMVSGWSGYLGQTPLISAVATDNSAVKRVTFFLYAQGVLLNSFPATLYSGTTTNGVWRATLEFRGTDFTGNWEIKAEAYDEAGNTSGIVLLRLVPVSARS